jgi:hypothetical protein
LAAGQADLANRLNQHYLAINVLKHGTGASYRELLNNKGTVFVVKQSADVATNESEVSTGLIDVTEPHFFDGLVETILESFHFLENRWATAPSIITATMLYDNPSKFIG